MRATLLIALVAGLTAADAQARPVLAPGTYSGTVTTAVAVGKNRLPATLSGTWRVVVDRLGHLRGSEQLEATITFTSPDSDGCTYTPAAWVFGSKGSLGTSYNGAGTPGVVRGSTVLLDLSSSWYSRPSGYTRVCPAASSPWPFYVIYGAGGDTVTPMVTTLKLPLSLFTARGRSATTTFKNTWGTRFTQRYTLAVAPKK